MDHQMIDMIIKLIISAAAAVTGWYTALKPLLNLMADKKRRKAAAIEKVLKEDKEYREKVLEKLDALDNRVAKTDKALSLLQKENIERAYYMFVVEHGYCPSGMKRAISETWDFYNGNGHDELASDRMKELMSLPEFPKNKGEEK